MEEHSKRISVAQLEIFGGPVVDGDSTIVATIAWLQKHLDSVPVEYRDNAKIDIDSVGGYEGEHHVEIRIYYCRPETEAEMVHRLGEEKRRAIAEEERLCKQYERAVARRKAVEQV